MVGSPILTAPCPIVLAALGFDFLGWVNVVKIYHSTSAKIADRKSPKTKVVRRTP